MVICRVCDRLVRAAARGTIALSDRADAAEFQRRNPRAQAWYPVAHPAQDDDTGGRECAGSEEPH